MVTSHNKIKLLSVGGSVRDLLLGHSASDYDFLIAGGSVEDFKQHFPKAHPVGKAYEIFYYKGMEFSFPRVKGNNIEDTINRDLAARDFTVNSFAIDDEGELYAHPSGLEDLANRTLRPCFEGTFKEDPLRVFRAAAFLARFPDFSPHPDLISGMREAASNGWLEYIAPDRVGVELRKGLSGIKPGNFLLTLLKAGCLEPWFSELNGSENIPAGPELYHDKSVAGHTAEIMNKVAGCPLTCWMAMCHDLGKILTPEAELPSHHGHDVSGADQALKLGKRLLLPTKFIQAGEISAKLHMKAGNYEKLKPGKKVDLLMKLHVTGLLDNMESLTAADRGTNVMKSSKKDLAEILKVSLPMKDRNLGKESGEKLRNLRASRLKACSRSENWQNLLK